MVLSGMDYSGLERLYTAEQTQALDSAAIHSHGIPGITLMARAAQASFDCLLSLWPQTNCVQILCGTGSNGGDGYLLADIAHKRGIDVTVWQLGNADRISGDAALALQQAVENGVEIRTFCTGCLANSGVVVDAMLGTGLSGDLREPFAGAVSEVNALDVPVLAIDIPSGLCADSGRILGVAVKAWLPQAARIMLASRSSPAWVFLLMSMRQSPPRIICSICPVCWNSSRSAGRCPTKAPTAEY